MALSTRLMLRQGQSLVMTPQLLQAIKLLQFSSLELSAYVEQELERNPLLERVEEIGDRESAPETAAAEIVRSVPAVLLLAKIPRPLVPVTAPLADTDSAPVPVLRASMPSVAPVTAAAAIVRLVPAVLLLA